MEHIEDNDAATTLVSAAGVPDYRIDYRRERNHSIAVCIFVINEGEKLRQQLRKMVEFTDQVDIIIADGGSTDDSFAGDILEECGVHALLTKTGGGKLSAQMRMAFHYCRQQGFNGVIVIDGNGKDGLQAIPEFIRKLNDGWDHIQGSRFIPGGHHENTPRLRWLAVNLLHAPLISLAAGFRYTDTTNGFRGYSLKLLTDPNLDIFRPCFDRYQLHYYLAIEAVRRHFRVLEIPVSRCYPAAGKTPTKINGLRALCDVFAQLSAVCLGLYRP